ncbi:hypothetical protein [Cytophaga aurantiaca]|uniref:DUF7935 family protein n=1 Tax=Cytophaga aurantiaca TaxID=29530 RepID=UPI000373755C|nr:hypothetical protein [Cytophaga aurantiaca]
MSQFLSFLSEFIKIVLPAALVIYGMYLIVNTFLQKEFEKRALDIQLKNADIQIKNNELILPIRFQAYERVCLFLERIAPHNLILSSNEPGMSAGQLQQQMLFNIREEFAHNMSQQVYMSDDAWKHVKDAMENIVSVINNSAQIVPSDARSIDLAKIIVEVLMQLPTEPTAEALQFVKNEIRQVM